MEDDLSEVIDRARGDRAEVMGASRLYTALFIAMAGPLAMVVMSFLDYPPSQAILYVVYATAPVGVLLGIINLFRLNRFSMGAVAIFFFTLVAAGFTIYIY